MRVALRLLFCQGTPAALVKWVRPAGMASTAAHQAQPGDCELHHRAKVRLRSAAMHMTATSIFGELYHIAAC